MNAAEAARRLRHALGACPTGVAIVTTRTQDACAVGLTVNSFASLSLDPPLLLWSLDKRSRSQQAFRSASHFAINVLAQGQATLARRFATPAVSDRFDGVALQEPAHPAPLIDGALAHFVCATQEAIDAGDHTLFIGRIERHDRAEGLAPLVFHGGDFVRLAPH